jgi:hypothetical protein
MTSDQFDRLLQVQIAQLAVMDSIMRSLAIIASSHGKSSTCEDWGMTKELLIKAKGLLKV